MLHFPIPNARRKIPKNRGEIDSPLFHNTYFTLPAQAQPRNDCTVAFRMTLTQIAKQTTTFAD